MTKGTIYNPNYHKAEYYVRDTETGEIYPSLKTAAINNNMAVSTLKKWIEEGIPMRNRLKQHFEPVAVEDVTLKEILGPRGYSKKGPDSVPELEVGEYMLISANGRLIMHDKSIRGLSGRCSLSRGDITRMLNNGTSDDLGRTVDKIENESDIATVCGDN